MKITLTGVTQPNATKNDTPTIIPVKISLVIPQRSKVGLNSSISPVMTHSRPPIWKYHYNFISYKYIHNFILTKKSKFSQHCPSQAWSSWWRTNKTISEILARLQLLLDKLQKQGRGLDQRLLQLVCFGNGNLYSY